VPGLDLVALAGAGAVDDDPGAGHGGVDPLAGGQVAGDHLDALAELTPSAAEHADLAAGRPQSRDDQPPQGAGAAGDQDGCRHDLRSLCHIVPAFRVTWYDNWQRANVTDG
jgi:hypothetical protein